MTQASAVPLVPARLVRGARGAVVAPHHLATQAGLGVLTAGGSAVDAAIATNAVLGVVMPSGCGIGGDAFWLVWDAAERRQRAINGSGRAAVHHRAWCRAIVGRCPRSTWAAIPGRHPRAGHRARRPWLPGLGWLHRR